MTDSLESIFNSLCIHRVYMAKLYWRVKRDGKWTWVAADERNTMDDDGWFPLLTYKEEEE